MFDRSLTFAGDGLIVALIGTNDDGAVATAICRSDVRPGRADAQRGGGAALVRAPAVRERRGRVRIADVQGQTRAVLVADLVTPDVSRTVRTDP